MKKTVNIAAMALAALISPHAAHAATPRILLQNSSSYAVENEVRAFRLPTIDQNGVTRFWDVTIDLGIDPVTGKPTPLADVVAVPSPSIATGVIAPGTYKSPDNLTTCTVTNVSLINGRIQSFFNCAYNTSTLFNVSVATGQVSAGHPFQTPLVSATINTKPDVNTYTWGLVTNNYFTIGSCGAFVQGYVIGAKTNGNQLVLSVFNSFTPGAFRCSGTLIKQ